VIINEDLRFNCARANSSYHMLTIRAHSHIYSCFGVQGLLSIVYHRLDEEIIIWDTVE
jgi:hypothetical protein